MSGQQDLPTMTAWWGDFCWKETRVKVVKLLTSLGIIALERNKFGRTLAIVESYHLTVVALQYRRLADNLAGRVTMHGITEG